MTQMINKTLGLFGLSIFLLVLLMGALSAVTLAEWPLTLDGVANPATLNTNVAAGNLAFGSTLNVIGTGFDVTDGTVADGWNANTVNPGPNDYYEVTLSPNSGFDLTINTVSFDHISSVVTTNMKFDVEWSLDGFTTTPTNLVSAGTSTTSSAPSSTTPTTSIAVSNGQTFSLRIFGYSSDSSTEVFSVKNLILDGTVTATPLIEPTEVTTCKNIGNPGELNVKDIDFKNFGILHLKNTDPFYIEFGDDDEWFPLDEVEVDIEIENNGDFDVDDIEVEWGIYNTRSNELIIKFEDEKDFNLKDGKDEIITVSFQLEDDLDVDLEDLDDGKHYRFYVTARGVIEDSKSPNDGEDTCASGFDTAEIIIEGDFVVLKDIEFPETVQCNADVQISAKVWNIGEDDQDEVKVEVHNNALGLFHKMTEIGDIDAFDDDLYNFNFKVPSDAEEKTHTLEFRVFDEDFDVYENDFDDDESKFFLPFRVSGGCFDLGAAEVSISASLESGGKAGEDLVVRATVTNNGDELNTFRVNAVGFSGWAASFIVDRSTLVLDAGDSVDVVFTFDVNRDASGSQSFSIELVSEDNQVTTQPVSIAIIEERGGLFGLTGAITSGNAYLWGIGLLNLILVIIIIVVAIRVARR